MKRDVWGLDRFTFCICGTEVQRFLNRAAESNIRLENVVVNEQGLTATAFGADHAALQKIAQEGNWRFETMARRGPGRFLNMLLARPGLPVGLALFLCLAHLFGGLVWTIDFGTMEEEQLDTVRTLLADCGIWEGVRMDDDLLQRAQVAALQQSDVFGWISLNFTGGCLYIENTEAEYQTIREPAPQRALYAKEGGEILAVEAESGFAAVEIGQRVEAGQLLVDVVRLDRSGNPVQQGAAGRIVARVQKSYTALQPYSLTTEVLSGQCAVMRQWYLPGWALKSGEPIQEQARKQVEWIPLRLGRLSLPGCIRQTTGWYQQEQTLSYTETQAQAMAFRQCRQQLYAEFPDAVIEAEQRAESATLEGVLCTIQYQFCADIASSMG